MIYKTLLNAVKLAQEFIEASEPVIQDAKEKEHTHYLWGTKDTGHLQRVSMELTRKLADLRQNR